jgi:branched-chain amino acid transport system substrate-binding protein
MHVRYLLPALSAGIALALSGAALPAWADINVGVTLSATGPAASLGIPEKNTFDLLPTTIGGEKVNWIILDDASDTTKAVTNTRKLIAEDKVDVVVGSTITPNSLAMVDVVADAETPMISMAASAAIVNPANPKTRWVFKTPQNDALMADAIAVHMKANGVKTMGYIGFADAYGDGWLAEMRRSAQTAGIKIVAEEKYNRNDASVTGQVLKLIAANPDAVLIGAAGTPGATPQKELVARNYKGKIYQTHGIANPDFLRVAGKDANGTVLPIGPMLVYEQLPDSNPLKKSAAEYITKYEAKYGKDSRSTFGGHAWDAYLLLARAVPEAQKRAKPGTKEFRAALRDALENTKELVASHGVFTMTPQDHNGLDNRARTMIKIENGKWVLAK